MAILFLAGIPKGMSPAPWSALVWGLTSSVAIFALSVLLLKREGRVPPDVGLRVGATSAGRFIAGASIGFGVYGLILLSTWVIVGPIRFTRVAAPEGGAIFLMLGTYLALSVMEELGFRGYPLQTLVSAFGAWRAQAVVAAAFCLSHVAFGWPWQTIALGVLPSGILFGVAALAVRDVAMPIGLHAAMNIARWMVGETGAQGIWTMAIDDQARAHVAGVAPLIGFAVTGLCAAALWLWHLRYGPLSSPARWSRAQQLGRRNPTRLCYAVSEA